MGNSADKMSDQPDFDKLQPAAPATFFGGGHVGDLIRAFDWSRTSLGDIAHWPQSLKAITQMILLSPAPIVMFWGPDHVLIYNEAYAPLAGARHPALLGQNLHEAWPEIVDFHTGVLNTVLAGGTLTYRDQELTLYRNNEPEQVWLDINYSPVPDDAGQPAGVIAIVFETTERVRFQRDQGDERERLMQLFEQSPSFMALLAGPEHVFELVNPGYAQLIGHRDVIGKPLHEALPEVVRQGFGDILDRVYKTGEAFVGTSVSVLLQRSPDSPEEERNLDFVYQPLKRNGVVTGIFVEGYDVTERARAEAKVRDREQRFRALVTATSDVIYRMSADWKEMRALDGRGFVPDTESPNAAWMDAYVFPEDQAQVRAAIQDAIDSRSVFQLEHRVRRIDGSVGWVLSRAVPLFDAKGEIMEWFGTASDMTARHMSEQHLKLVVNELNHRVKNNLAMMQSIAAQTFRSADDLPHAQANFTARIRALAQANDLLTGERGAGVSLRGALEQSVRPHCGDFDRCVIEGPDVRLSAKTALALSLAAHELATNAIKYGSLSVDEGKVRITWMTFTTPDGIASLRIEWRESGGPPVAKPAKRGFGSRLIERGLAAEMGGTAEMRFLPEGLQCVVVAPLSVYGDAAS